MRCLIVPNPDTTSLNIIIRCMSIADEAVRQGHEVCVAAPHELIGRFTRPGVEVCGYPLVPHIDRVHLEAPPIKKYGDYAELIGLNSPAFIADSIEAEMDAVNQFKPAVIYSDLSLTTSITSRLCRIPLASLCNLAWTPPFLLDETFRDDPAQVEPFNAVLGASQLPPVRDLSELIFMFSDLKIVPTCPEFEQFHPAVGGVEYIGYLYSEGLEDRLAAVELPAGMKKALVYMGIGDIDLEMMTRVLPEAFDGTDYYVSVVLGDFYGDEPPPTSNVKYHRFLPLKQMLAQTDVAIFHGGSGLVMNCMLYGVPGLMFPCGVYEREFHAETMAQVRAGVVLYDRDDFNAANLRRYTDEIVRGEYRKNAAAFGDYLRSLGGPARAVRLLEGLAQREAPAPVEADSPYTFH